ncbi:MAG: hypothetical protein JWN04_5717 [Myxococcaceae bacterium]|nr:hypothetical protein [Myxococcaceae bacterium]
MRLEHIHSGLNGTTHSTLQSDCAATANHEVCPLCLARYAAAVECICVACEAPSCPDCAERLPGTQSMLCYACPVPTKH